MSISDTNYQRRYLRQYCFGRRRGCRLQIIDIAAGHIVFSYRECFKPVLVSHHGLVISRITFIQFDYKQGMSRTRSTFRSQLQRFYLFVINTSAGQTKFRFVTVLASHTRNHSTVTNVQARIPIVSHAASAQPPTSLALLHSLHQTSPCTRDAKFNK